MLRTADRVVPAAVFAVALASAGFGSPAQAETTLTVGKAAANSDAIIPVNVGDQVGIFKKHGLTLKIVDFSGGSKMAQALAAGSIDIGDGAGTEMVLTYKGVPAKAICESAGPLSFLAVGVAYDSPIKSLDQLKGKRIGISRAGSLTDHLAHALAEQKGWGENGIKTVAIGNGSAGIIAAFRQDQIDADISTSSLFFTMEEQKTGRLLAPVSDFMGRNASGALYATNKLMKENPAAVRAFVAGWIDTIAWMRSHKAETVKIEAKLVGFPESVMSKQYDLTIGMFTDDCRFDKESLKNLKDTFVKLKEMPESVDMSTLYTEEFLPKKKKM
jgi:ABC-type nitrate/sulfonate/bicarbonate transport system substrate-binding protein